MNPVIDNIDNPEPQFMFHKELIYWLEKNMKLDLHVTRETTPGIVTPDGNLIAGDTEFVTISAHLTINQQDAYKGNVFPNVISSQSVKFLAVKNDRVMYGGATNGEQRVYNDLHRMATKVNNLLVEIQQLKGALQHVQYPLPEEIK